MKTIFPEHINDKSVADQFSNSATEKFAAISQFSTKTTAIPPTSATAVSWSTTTFKTNRFDNKKSKTKRVGKPLRTWCILGMLCMKWKKNTFLLQTGASGKRFITETTRLIDNWNNKCSISNASLKLLFAMPSLLLQKPSKSSKAKDHFHNLLLWGNLARGYIECI